MFSLQLRATGEVDFNRNWDDYENGFGDVGGEFWLGLSRLAAMCGPSQGCQVEIQVHHRGQNYYARYSSFRLVNEKLDRITRSKLPG